MWPLLTTYLLKPKVLLAIGLGALLFFGVMWYGAKREEAGRAEGQRTQLETDKQQFEQVQKKYQEVLASNEKTIETANAKISSLEAQIQSLSAQFQALATLRQQQAAHVASLTDVEVKADLELQLGGPLDNPAVLRKADRIVTDYPVVVKQLDVQTQKVDKLIEDVAAINVKVDALTRQRDAAIQFGDQVVGYYVKAYNAAQKKHSRFVKIITFGLVKDRHLELPAPTTLIAPR